MFRYGIPRAIERAMAKTAHYHTFDIHPKYPTMASCTICGFSCPAIILKSRTLLDVYTMRRNASPALLDLLSIDRDGNPVMAEDESECEVCHGSSSITGEECPGCGENEDEE